MTFIAFIIGIFNIVVATLVTCKVGKEAGCFGKVALFIGSIILLKLIEFVLISIFTLLIFV